MKVYTSDFFKWMQKGSCSSAKEIIPLTMELIKPKKVVDVGCGTGTWLAIFKEYGVTDILGIDGDWVNRNCCKYEKASLYRMI